MEEYPFDDFILDIFSHQKILGFNDYFNLYWLEFMGMEEDDMEEMYECFSEEDFSLIEKVNKEYFVCIADWSENFIETFIFDKEHNYYHFCFDQDDLIIEYIEELINGSSEIKKDKSLLKLLSNYLKIKEKEIEE